MFRPVLVLLTLIIPAIAATDPSRPNDNVFAAYSEAIEAQMVAMLNRPAAPQSKLSDYGVGQTVPSTSVKPADTAVRAFANQYWRGHEDSLRRALDRLSRLRPTLEGVLESEGLPKSLVAVVLVESAGDPLALSPKQARGLWQMIPDTGRLYGLTISARQDDRIQTEKATQAAARFLRDLFAEFHDWPLALAAYNSGRQTVERALQKSGGAEFWTMSSQRLLPDETLNYVPAVLSAMQLFDDGLPAAHQSNQLSVSRSGWVYAGTHAGN